MNARVAQLFGGRAGTTTLPSASTLIVPDNATVIFVTGTTTIMTLLLADRSSYNRLVFLVGGPAVAGVSTNIKLTNTNATTTEGQMSLRGSDQSITEGVGIGLYVLPDRTWQMIIAP